MNRHEDCLGSAQDYFEGRLDGPERGAFEAHRAGCPDCRRILDRWAPEAPVPDLARAVENALRAADAAAPAPPEAARVRGWALALAAAFTLALAVSAFWHPERQWARDGGDCMLPSPPAIRGGMAWRAD